MSIGRPWSTFEDQLLISAVERHGERDRWKAVAQDVPNRTNKACRKRWLHSLSPEIKKTAWTPEEDQQLLTLYDKFSTKWSTIARHIPGRTDDACSKRYREALDPHLKKDEWTPDEDTRLTLLVDTYIGRQVRWKNVGQDLQRASLSCRNRWKLLQRKKAQGMSEPAIPYYPPEAYAGLLSSEESCRFREASPEALPLSSPHVAPFQFSSSSLSAALSDPPRIHRPLPPDPPPPTSDIVPDEPDPLFSTSLSVDSQFFDDQDELMPLDDSIVTQFTDTHMDLSFPDIQPGDADAMSGPDVTNNNQPTSISPIQIHTDFLVDEEEPTALPPLPIIHYKPPSPSRFNGPSLDRNYEDLSSTSSSPYDPFVTLSATSSPNTDTPVGLPATDPLFSGGSLLFSSHYRPPSAKRTRAVRPLKSRTVRPVGESRLSSIMPLSADKSVRPYACGYPGCWQEGASESKSCFRTSKDLFNHTKFDHDEDDNGTPFRCGLAGCGKSWKSLNGLQYHLQISTIHFRNALSSRFSEQSAENNASASSSPQASDATNNAGAESDSKKGSLVCPHPQCFKVYRHSSGLRYHMKHGHPKQQPAQLTVVPPSLERELPARAKKMRAKSTAAAAVVVEQE